MAPKSRKRGSGGGILWDLLTFDRLISGPLIHLIYWAGLGVIVLGAFGAIGAAVGVVLSDEDIMGKLLALPVSVAGLLVCVALIMLWRSFCEFYVAIFRISEDLRALRQANDAEQGVRGPTPPPSF
ncbi:MAG: DUF4282 domain-containing protein [Pseudomonadota bacterium]